MQRRGFLKLGIGAAIVVGVAGAGVALIKPGLVDGKLGPGAREVMRAAALAVLSDQERAVAGAVGRGYNNATIAAELHLSLSTVKTYISGALAKLDLDNRTQLALLAHEAGLAGNPSR